MYKRSFYFHGGELQVIHFAPLPNLILHPKSVSSSQFAKARSWQSMIAHSGKQTWGYLLDWASGFRVYRDLRFQVQGLWVRVRRRNRLTCCLGSIGFFRMISLSCIHVSILPFVLAHENVFSGENRAFLALRFPRSGPYSTNQKSQTQHSKPKSATPTWQS